MNMTKAMQALRAKMPREVQEQTALERQVFDNEKSAESAARAHFSRFPINEHGLRLTSRLVSQLHKRTVFFLRGGEFTRGASYLWQGVAS